MQGNDLCLMTFEIALWLEVVIDGWHIAFPIASAAYLTGIGLQDTPICSDEYAEHLALRDFVMPFGMRLNVSKNSIYIGSKVKGQRSKVKGQRSKVKGLRSKVCEVAFYWDTTIFVFVVFIEVYPMTEGVHRGLGGMF